MKLNRIFSAVLSAALLINLCACDQTDPVGDNPSASVSASARPSPTSEPSEALPEGSASPEPTPSSFTQYDKDYRLDVSIPKLIDGLEMPVVGATGYTSVSLPLWPSIPDKSATTPKPAPSPSPSPSPSLPQPAPSPSESPAVTETPWPGPDEPPVIGPIETPEPGPVETPEPDPIETLEPDPVETPEPTPQQPPEPMPEPVPAETPDSMAAQSYTAAFSSMGKSARALSSYAGAITVWEPGVAFLILEESGSWWRVSRGNETGWIEHRYCMVNLPDVIPSMIYGDANAYSSLFVSCGKDIPDVTGEAFCHSLVYNVRLDRQEFVMPILYSAARNICAAQHRALAEGNCLVVYQAFRPGVSNHQRGYALDVSMVKVSGTETRYVGSYPYLYVTSCANYQMPTAMHELSIAAISTVSPASSRLSETMNEPAIALRGYFTASGLSPLASEWWHFDDLAAMQAASANPSDGKYSITECLSCVPERASQSLL